MAPPQDPPGPAWASPDEPVEDQPHQELPAQEPPGFAPPDPDQAAQEPPAPQQPAPPPQSQGPPGWTATPPPPGYGPGPAPGWVIPSPSEMPPARPPERNGLAVAALITGLCSMVLLSVIFAIIALVQIQRRGQRGRGMAIGGLVLSAAWIVVVVIVGVLLVVREDLQDPENSSLHTVARTGECFNQSRGDSSADMKVVPCNVPHDGQMVASFKLPGGSWPGDAEVDRLGDAGCKRVMFDTFKTRLPFEDVTTWIISPRRLGWRLGDRTVHCALTRDGARLDAPIPLKDPGTRAWEELKPGDCINFREDDMKLTVPLLECTVKHTGQLADGFTIPAGPWPGQSKISDTAGKGCRSRLTALFKKHPTELSVTWFTIRPTEESWAQGDHQVLCVVTAKKGDLDRSVIPS